MSAPDDSGVDVARCLARSSELAAVSDSCRLDLELLLALALGKDRTWLYTWPEKTLTPTQLKTFEEALVRRQKGEPLAHITGRREFWSLSLRVNASTLIPRPDTELLVMETLARFAADPPGTRRQMLDLGTGTGAVALALASECPDWHLRGLEVAPEALALAELNRHDLGLNNAEFLHSDWFAGLTDGRRYHAIVSNPPYIAPDDPHLTRGDVRFEPRSALVAQERGLADIVHIATQARDHLAPGGWLLLEHGWDQGAAVRQLLEEAGYREVETQVDLGGQERVTYGRKAGEA